MSFRSHLLQSQPSNPPLILPLLPGGFDPLRIPKPTEYSPKSSSSLCYVAFADAPSLEHFKEKNLVEEVDGSWMGGRWRIVVVSDPPYNGSRRAARVGRQSIILQYALCERSCAYVALTMRGHVLGFMHVGVCACDCSCPFWWTICIHVPVGAHACACSMPCTVYALHTLA